MYKSAFIIGKFFPFHLGHKHLIDTALCHCDKVTILVGTLPTESIPGDIRYHWVKETYKDVPNANVVWCNEVLPQYPEDDKNFWDIWVDVAKRYCPSDIDVIFSSELYGDTYAEHLGIKHHLVDLERKQYPVSGTFVRNETYKYWDFLPDVVKPYFVKRIAIMGPESTGKSVLTEKLANHFNTNFVEEYGKRYYIENGYKVTPKDFPIISYRRQLLEDFKIKSSNKILICDTEDITTYYLLKEYCTDWKSCEEFFTDKFRSYKNYDLYLLLDCDCNWVQDGTRLNEEDRARQYNIIKESLINRNCNFIEINGDWENRFNQSVTEINKVCDFNI